MFVSEAEQRCAQPLGDPGALPGGDHSTNRLKEIPLERLEHEICAGAGAINARMARWLELVAEFDRRRGWVSWGCRCCADWLAWRCAISPRTARDHALIARRLGELALIAAAFGRGELSYSKVRALCRIAEPATELDLLELAEHATAAQLERITNSARRVIASEAEEIHQRRCFTYWWDALGALNLSALLAPEEGRLLLEAMSGACRDIAAEQAASASAEPPRASYCDGLVRIAEAYLSHDQGSARGSASTELVVHVDPELLAGDDEGRAELDRGPAISAETARRLACDAVVVPLLRSGNEILALGRKTRVVSAAQRRALQLRDGGCRFPGCEAHRYVDAHHVIPWSLGGPTDLDNLVLLCRTHHRLVHEGGFSVSRLADGSFGFERPDERPIPAVPPSMVSAEVPDRPGFAEVPFPGSAEPFPGSAEPFDLRGAVDLALRGRPVRVPPGYS